MPLPPHNAGSSTKQGANQPGEQRKSLEATARQLAAQHSIRRRSPAGMRRIFMDRLQQQQALLQQVYEAFAHSSAEKAALSYAAEWFLDNYYLLQRTQRQVQEDFPPGYYAELPSLDGEGPLQGYPRIFDVARTLVIHEGCDVEGQRVRRFLRAYQQVQNLDIGELWAVPVMLRVVLLESILQAARRLTAADHEAPPTALRMEHALGDDEIIAICIPALHALAREDWKATFEAVSRVEQTLGDDPAQLYARMDFETRDRYRKVVEELARAAATEESLVAREALALAQAAHDAARRAPPAPSSWDGLNLPRQAHVGYYLIDKGRAQLERRLAYHPGPAIRFKELLLAHPTFLYIGGIIALMLLLLWGALRALAAAQGGPLLTMAALMLLLIPALSVSTSLVNWALTLLRSPHVLPKLDFSEGIPDLCRTIVVVPCMLTDEAEVNSLLRQLEGHYLRNPDPNLLFALLSDFGDSDVAEKPEDEALLDVARQGIKSLNRRYPHRPFYLFHRRRLWNPREEVWMGWERKRGKLHEFNRLLRGAQDTSFSLGTDDRLDDLQRLPHVRYVITLDADTILPLDSATTLVGALAHPLNQAQFEAGSDRVIAGYTVLQPRTAVKPDAGRASLFTRVFAGDTGLDLYTRAVSDVYQDLFGEGIYVGKGIYDVDAFERSLRGRIPQNTLLSHDLFEGIHGRAALVTDIVLYEDYPSNYLLNVHRSHRWIRGDWQLLPWLLPMVPTADGWQRNRLRLIDLWKIGDNLRRSLLAPTLLLALIAGWTMLPGSPLAWTLVALLTPAAAQLANLASPLVRLIAGDGADLKRPLRDSAVRWLLFVAFLPYEAILNLDAIFTTLVRLLVTRRHLLQWTTSAHSARLFGEDVSADLTWKNMISSFLVAAILGVLLFLLNPPALRVALPLLALWAFAPELAYWISRPQTRKVKEIGDAQRQRLRRLARRTWFFYEQFVGPEDNWLPPDHFQEAPKGIVAHRTSPTNIGLYLLSAIAAYDFGAIDAISLMARLRSTFDTLQNLDRHRGHFLNWIDTTTLAPLPPRYVSTVDSGNLAGSFIVLQMALEDLPRQPAFHWERWQGLRDTLNLLSEAVSGISVESGVGLSFTRRLPQLGERILSARGDPDRWPALLQDVIERDLPALEEQLITLLEAAGGSVDAATLHDCRLIMRRVHEHCRGMQREFDQLLPWLALLHDPPALLRQNDAAPHVAQAWRATCQHLSQIPTLHDLTSGVNGGRRALATLQAALQELDPTAGDGVTQTQAWVTELCEGLVAASTAAQRLVASAAELAQQAERYVTEMDFRFLFHHRRQLFHIGYNLDAGKLDDNYYDLLASEARIASLIAIAKHDAPLSHWLHLGRPTTLVQGRRTLLSWSGTMFEYLMPPLFLRSDDESLLGSSERNAIDYQIDYAARRKVPWGVSEAGFYAFDAARNYQYRAFGVPGLGLKRGLGEDTVVAPYASLLALPFHSDAVLDNLDALDALGMQGRFGYYEAVDFTASRLAPGQNMAIVRSYMAHHQGMIMLSLLNSLQNQKVVHRFHAHPRIQSIELLLQEQMPQGVPVEAPDEEERPASRPQRTMTPAQRWQAPLLTPQPILHVLTNGSYSVLLTNAGAGYSRWRDVALTRWRPDTTLDDWGQWLYVEDRQNGARWSAGLQPSGVLPADDAEFVFHAHKVTWRRRDHDIVLRAEVTVSPEDDIEIRRISLTNDSDQRRRLRLTSYAEVALAEQNTDLRHPAFAKLFVESAHLSRQNALLFHRRLRSDNENPVFMAHMLLMAGGAGQSPRFETDRRRFLGRNRSVRNPRALEASSWLSGTTGATLDPIMCLGQEIELQPYATVELALVTAAGESQPEIEALLDQYRSWARIARTFDLARARAERELQQIDLETPLETAQLLLSHLLYPHAALRADSEVLASNTLGQPALWANGISGDDPILLVRVKDASESTLLHELIQVHTYWHRRGLKIDLVILGEQASGYEQTLPNVIHRLIRRAGAADRLHKRGGIYVINADQIDDADRRLLHAAARVVLDASRGDLRQQMGDLLTLPTRLPALEPSHQAQATDLPPLTRPDNLLFDNGYGGFTPGDSHRPAGKEYVIYLRPGESTPAPWINVIANPQFGFLVSESGSGCTWAQNSGENRLTTWRNDPVTDLPAEALYLRDEETAQIWSPTPQPAPAEAPYLVRHGAGYTIFEHHSHGLKQEVTLFAAVDAPLKLVRVRLQNVTSRQRRLTATYYAAWVLGTVRAATQQYLIPEYIADCHALLVRNPYNVEFGERVAFLAADRALHGLTTDRTEFLGRLGSLQRPQALRRIGLESNVRAGLDSCGVLQLHVDLAPSAGETFTFLLGQGADRQESLQLIERFQQTSEINAAWEDARRHWDDLLETVQVETPDAAMNILLNRWLLYQTLSCRLWGRSALYQSSGAYGFRDQLQDVMALIHARPQLAREHILRAARHQFEAGDVLHWWHPPSGRGVRTRIKDDLLWLPFVTTHYVAATGDRAILDEPLPFLQGDPLQEGEEERYGLYSPEPQTHSLFEHCVRALNKGSTRGRHGLPLMGAGDWNDGMNRVGIEGQGESVWLGWFLYATLKEFADLCRETGRDDEAPKFDKRAEGYRQALAMHAWDGAWYRRAYYDDGTPLGSQENKECQIDAIAQSWSVLSGAGRAMRMKTAMDALSRYLIDRDERLMLLFAPPFDQTGQDPGYIKGYPPGIRENGGQYTHAALWSIWAFAEMGQGEQAEALFRLINPIYHGANPQEARAYRVEPYVVAADVYGGAMHRGQGGWTWYTGSAAWMYRLGLEAILGLRKQGASLSLQPRIPPGWQGYTITYRAGDAAYHIEVTNGGPGEEGTRVILDGEPLPDARIPLQTDEREHHVQVFLSRPELGADPDQE